MLPSSSAATHRSQRASTRCGVCATGRRSGCWSSWAPRARASSSFLNAGLLARLIRDEENFLVLPVLRPGRATMSGPTGLANALGLGLPLQQQTRSRSAAPKIRAPVVDRLRRYAEAGKQTLGARPPTLVLPIDQGEELFAADQTEGAAVTEAIAAAVGADQNLLLLVTIRSESFSALQADATLAAVPRLPFDLPALPLAAFGEVIEGPGRLSQPLLRVEEALTAQLVADLDRADALPLLAFTLERLVVTTAMAAYFRWPTIKTGSAAWMAPSAVPSTKPSRPRAETRTCRTIGPRWNGSLGCLHPVAPTARRNRSGTKAPRRPPARDPRGRLATGRTLCLDERPRANTRPSRRRHDHSS